MSNFLDDNLNQSVFLDINYLEVLGENTFEYCLYELITNTLDLDEFYRRYKNKKVGRKAYPPALLLRVIFYAYYKGITSSRAIERFCNTDLKFMALASGRTPHFTTLADFVSSNCDEMKALFYKVLMICCKSGLVGNEHFAIDGCKLPSDASKQWSGTHADLNKKSTKLRQSAEKIVDTHLSSDSNRDPGNTERELVTADTLIKNASKIDDFLSNSEKRMGVGKRKKEVQSNITDNDSTKMTTSKGTIQGYNCQAAADELFQIVVATEAFGVGQDQSLLKPMVDEIKNNLGEGVFSGNTLLTADTGYSSEANMEYVFTENLNAVIPDTHFRQRDPKIAGSESVQKHKEHRQKTHKDRRTRAAIIPAEEFTVNQESKVCICPNGNEMQYLGDDYESPRGKYMRFRGKLQDCRSCSMQQQCMKNPVKEKGRQVSFLVEGQNHTSYLDLMRVKIDSVMGRKAYAKRMWTIEPVFGNITSNKGLSKLHLRGKEKVSCQWMMYCMVHNIEKLWRYGDNPAT